MRKRVLAAALLAGACSLGVAACGGSDGGGDTTTAAPAATSEAAPATTESAGGDAGAGKVVFTANCSGCHTLADAAASGAVGPNLDDLKPDESTVKTQVENGGGAMPAFKGTLSDAEIASVAAYVASVAGS